MIRKNVRKVAQGFSEKTKKIFFLCCLSPDSFFPSNNNISNQLNNKPSTTNYHIQKLRRAGLINKHNQVTELGKKLYKFIVGWDNSHLENCPKRLRAHNIQVTFSVTRANKSLSELSTIYQPFTNKRYNGIKAELCGCTIMFYSSKKIVAVLSDIYANTDEEIASSLISIVADLKSALETEFFVIINGYKLCKFTSMHVAVINSVIAESFLLHGKTFRSDELDIDGSHAGNEIEAVNPNTALQYGETLMKIEDYAREVNLLRTQLNEAQSLLRKNSIDYKNKDGGD